MIDCEITVKSSTLKWIKGYLNPEVNATWKNNIDTFCNVNNLGVLLQSSFCCKELPSTLPKFYMDSLILWYEIRY